LIMVDHLIDMVDHSINHDRSIGSIDHPIDHDRSI